MRNLFKSDPMVVNTDDCGGLGFVTFAANLLADS